MSDVTGILNAIEQGEPRAAELLLPLVYGELRKLAAARLAHEKPGQTLDATGLVHEAYLRLVDAQKTRTWNSRGHFFGAAAEAMRRILIESARRKSQEKHGGGLNRVEFSKAEVATQGSPDQLLAIDEALTDLESHDAGAAQLFKLRYFAGCSVEEGAELLGMSRAAAYRHWTFARAWLLARLQSGE